jgi:hypothetical protein
MVQIAPLSFAEDTFLPVEIAFCVICKSRLVAERFWTAAIAPIFVLMLIILIPLLFAFGRCFYRRVFMTNSLLPSGYESDVTAGNKIIIYLN